MNEVLLINMPFSNLRWPNLGLGLLKAAITKRRIACEVAYLNFDLAERVGLEHYTWLADHFAFVLGGERLFSPFYFNETLADDETYYREILLETDAEMSADEFAAYLATSQHVGPFLDEMTAKFDWSRYRVVGFTDSFQQTMASVCLAKRIKQINPDVRILFGGAACEAEMGVELLRLFEEIDYVFLGESDLTLTPLVEQLLEQSPLDSLPPGVVGRELPRDEWDSRPATAADARVEDMDSLPVPDFDDFFRRHAQSPLRDEIQPLLFFETSRGCWWGEKHHCAFCGLNGAGLVYRSKSARRAVAELKTLVDRHDIHQGCSADNIFDHRYFDTFLPLLSRADLDFSFVYEMKTSLRREQVQTLLDAGLGAAQLGIETFIPSVLKLIGKGATASHNLQTLKWFSEAGVEVKWNILYGFPQESAGDYAAFIDLLPALFHLAPPLAIGRVRLDRFSRYFEDPEKHGMANPRPNAAFSY
ncbi:MAG: RiPP maturation radical SAM C-methyltransferase, partial [Planctomycetota bacterium]|nr:RiPP maturation radical SAM C-methyltransferase [Planctomycetota bacterium]